MKKLFVIVLAAIGMVSCMNTDEVIEVNNDNAIAFADAFIENSVRAMIDETNPLNTFNVWGYMVEDVQDDAVTATVFEGKEVTNPEGAGWTYSPAQYWVPGFTYNFQALSSDGGNGWVATAEAGQVTKVAFTNNDGTEDLIYATASVEAPALGDAKTVSLEFNHQLAKVMFTINTLAVQNAIAPGFTVQADTIRMEVPKAGKLNLESGVWGLDGDETIELVFEAADEELLTIPANYAYGIKFHVNLYKGDEFVSTLKEMTSNIKYNIEKGKAYNFVADVTPEKMEMTTIDFDTIVNEWVDNNLGLDVDDTNTVHIKSAAALKAFAEKVNAGESFKGKTVVLDADIDLSSSTRAAAEYVEWTPIGHPGAYFEGTFDGKGHKVLNFQVTALEGHAGLFGYARATIKNLTVENVKLVAKHYAGGIVGQGYARLENCHAVNVDIAVSVKELENGEFDYGDKAGAIIGQNCEGGLYVKNSTAENVTIKGYRDLGGIAGMAHNNNTVSGCSVENITIIQHLANGYKTPIPTTLDGIVGRHGSNVTLDNNTEAEVNKIVLETYDDFLANIADDTWYDDTKTELAVEDVADFAAFVETANSGNDFEGKTIKLTGDIDLYFKDVTALADGDPITFRPIGDTQKDGGAPFKGTFDGQGHTIRNLYQNGWDLGYDWDNYGSYGLFGTLEDATVKNVVIEGSESYIEGGNVAFIAGCAQGDCVFENITINSGVAATYNNRCGGIVGWSGDEGNYTFKNITIGEDVVLGGLWGSFDSSIGGIVGQAKTSPSATYTFENITINCRIDAYNDCTASYDHYNYRMCGMIIGRCSETTTIDGKNYPDLSKYNLSFNNVVVNYGDWMNYHYCRRSGERAVRIEPGYSYGGATGRDHSGDNVNCMEWIPFNQLIGGAQYGVKGLPAVDGVTVNYPESFYIEKGYDVEGNTYKIYSGQGFKTVATTVLNDGSKNVTIELAKDIDLAGIEWPAVCTKAAFVLDGKGHAIKNLTTSAVEDHGFYSTAMFTSTRKATTIKNLVVENATVTGKGGDNSHGAVLVACNYAALNIENVTVKGSTISNCDRTGGLVTYLYFTTATVKGCVVEGCTINSIGTAGAILGMNNGHNFTMEGCQVVNTTVSSSEGNNKAGILIGTWQDAGTLTEEGNTHSGSKAINAGVETNNEIGRHQ